MATKSKALGFTLLELLIAMSLAVVVGLLMARVLVPAFRISAQTSLRSELHQRGAHALNSLSRDILSTTTQGFTTHAPAPAELHLALHLVDDANSDGKRVLANGMILYHWDGQDLARHDYLDPDPDFFLSAKRPLLNEVLSYISAARQSKVLARDLTSLQLRDSDPQPEAFAQPIILTIQLEGGPADKRERLELERKLTMPNS